MTAEITQDEARRLAKQCLGNAYDENSFRKLAANLLPDAETLAEGHVTGHIPESFREYVTSYRRLAKTREAGKEKLDVLAVKLKKTGQLLNARSMQRRFIARYLNGTYGGTLKDAALVAFYTDETPEWRLSLVYKDRVFEDGKVKSVLSEPKRASFLLGPHEPSHTAEQQFVELLQASDKSSIKRIRQAFSVERVTREFFREYRQLFLDLRDIVAAAVDSNPKVKKEFERNCIRADVYAKRMLGQIVFLYFLQKKGWLGVAGGQKWGSGSHAFLKELFEKNKNDDFFNRFLNPLFYDALATDRSGDDHFFQPLGCRIPFLNGGLFEPLHGYDWKNAPFAVPNSFFEKLFEVFDRFNFTVREDEPLESELAVDPEMLGKVFEGLLDVEERRGKGAFYTPRHVVHYMCRESLAQYLDRAVNIVPVYKDYRDALTGVRASGKTVQRLKREELVPLADIQLFIRQDEALEEENKVAGNKAKSREYSAFSATDLPDSVKKYAERLDKALENVKVCDPAIGSGAFAVGMMHEIVRARQVLHAACPDKFKKGVFTAYELKRNTIANSLYGVDIDLSAVDIAKLRLWLSLVVDENDYDQIKPLPNLDYKIMVGNSLDADKSLENKGNLLYFQACQHMEKLQKEFYDITSHAGKEEKRQEISAQRAKCGDIGVFDWYIDFFNVAGVFDIVIGNPPYIQIQGMDNSIKALKPRYRTFESTGDVYCLFYELGFNLLKPHGILTFITSNKWMRAAYGKSLRNFFLRNTKPVRVIDFAGNKVFDSATVDVNIMVLEKIKSSGNIGACTIKEYCANNLSDYIERNAIFTRFEVGESWAILSPIEQSIKRKIEAVGKPLKEWDVRINYGIKTGCNEAFIISGAKKDELIAQDPKSAEIIRPILRGRDIRRYGYNFADLWVIATFPSRHYDIDQYPAVKKHLLSFGMERLEQSGRTHFVNGKTVKARKKTNNKWFETQDSIGYWDDFSRHKIIWKRVGSILKFAYDEVGYLALDSTCFAVGKSLSYLTCVLNSKIGHYLLRNSPQTGTGDLLISVQTVENLFIPPCSDNKLYDKKLSVLINNNITIEDEIDSYIFSLCNFNKSEIDYIKFYFDNNL